jgi:hypothetical protein
MTRSDTCLIVATSAEAKEKCFKFAMSMRWDHIESAKYWENLVISTGGVTGETNAKEKSMLQ